MPAHERAVTLECAGNGRLEMRPLPTGEPWGDYAVSTARWRGALLHEVLPQARPRTDGVDVRFEGADHGAYHLNPVLVDTDRNDLTFVRALPLSHATDPAAEILVAYEMNGKPLAADHGSPFRMIVPHWYAVASVKWLKRIDVLTEPYTGEFQTGHYMYEWADRPPEPIGLMRVRAHHRPVRRLDLEPGDLHAARQGLVGDRARDPGRGRPHRRSRMARRAARSTHGPIPLAGLVV
jgi:DMSO/TMAO reductase YedYZ molybdopterin-dependent catalytic subunit